MSKWFMRSKGLYVAMALLAGSAAVQADYAPFQGYVEMPQTLSPMIMGNLASENLRLINEQNARGGGKATTAAAAKGVTIAPGSASTTTPRVLAARYPTTQRAQIEQAFSESLRSYRQIEAKFGIPSNDVAGAVAAFLAGSYMAYRDVDFPDRNFSTLVAQMRNVLASNPAFQRASAAEKREVYEQMAIIGTFMAVTREALKRQPPNATVAQNFRESARANLEQFLKTDASRVTINEQGLVIR
ncbi:DUF6683 family protein [Ideonella sp. BN130291]|uniref:DUF6683 family protein n=1 Tax=Ideonella sp. BN130291 TaxID=3112940 RepID=UPI002E253071|nr:DUF6683 family protein [Ideonella sp. BN130291]